MNIPIEQPCDCGGTYTFTTYGNDAFEQAKCHRCGSVASLIDPLSVSVTGERLLHRSAADLKAGDYSLSIVIGVMAVESFLTRLFLKLKGMESFSVTLKPPTAEQEAEWEKEFPKGGGFPNPANFVSQRLVGMTFDEFVAANNAARSIFSKLPDSRNVSPSGYFQDQLFRRRNRIAHWGYVNSDECEAQLCHTITLASVSILRVMDTSTDWVGLAQKIAKAARAGVATERERVRGLSAEHHDQAVEKAKQS